ncbi:MAG: hypothetical protein U0670_06610 [Anaerolineae bacterium]
MGHNDQPILSPDGSRVAYVSQAAVFVDWLRTVNGAGGFLPPSNIWILDVASRETFRIADQPADAIWTGPADPGTYILRSQPSWSPDGTRLAWMQWVTSAANFSNGVQMSEAQLVIYDFASANTDVIAVFLMPNPIGLSQYFSVLWGRPGILVENFRVSEAFPWRGRVYNSLGQKIAETVENDVPQDWAQDGTQDYLFRYIIYPDRVTLTWLDWRTGALAQVRGDLTLTSLSAGSSAAFRRVDEQWTLEFPGQEPIVFDQQIRPYGISRDGQSALYGRYETNPATGYGAYTVIAQTGAASYEIGRYSNTVPVWGPVTWQIQSSE